MIPSKLSLENFFSHKNSEVDFSLFSSALLIGNTEGDYTKSNGSGKSAIFESILWCLFNKSRVAMMDDVIRWGENTCKVSLDFTHDGKTYRVVRTRNRINSSSNVELKTLDSFGEWKDISGSTSGDTNQKIEETIKLDYKTFINSVYFRQNDISEFAESEPSKKKEILKSIVDISRWDEYERSSKSKSKELLAECKILQGVLQDYDKTKQTILESEDEMKSLAESIETLKVKREDVSKNISELKDNYQSIKQSLDTAAYDRAVSEIEKIKKEGKEKTNQKSQDSSSLERVKIEISDEELKLLKLSTDGLEAKDVPPQIVEELTSQLTYHKSNLIALKLELDNINSHKESSIDGSCPTCGHEFSREAHNAFLSSQEERLLEVKRNIQHHKIEADSISSQIDSWNKIIRDNLRLEKILLQKSNIEYKISLLSKERDKLTLNILSLEEAISNLKQSLKENQEILDSIKNEDFQKLRVKIKELEDIFSSLDLEISEKDKMVGRLQERLSVLHLRLEEMNSSKKSLDEKIQKISVFEKLTKFLSKSGIQTVLLDTIIEDLEKTSNVILQSICNEPSIIVLETQRVGSDGSSIVETLDLKVKKDGNLQNFKSLSGGEKFRISLALRVAMSEISSRYGGSCLEFLLLDEVNSPLDRYGVETLFVNVIKSLEDKYKILTITHDETLKEKFDNVINVTKINSESEIEFLTR
jgi:DNA repair exonuclease SbcCD ATPase subunit